MHKNHQQQHQQRASRSRSNSPSSSVDSLNRRKLGSKSNLKHWIDSNIARERERERDEYFHYYHCDFFCNIEKNVTSSKSKENVQVFTSLPPKVEGEIKCCLKLQISRINWLGNKDFKNEIIQNKKLSSANTINVAPDSGIIAKCVWWGEEPKGGALFRPRVVYPNQIIAAASSNSNLRLQTVAKYMIRSGPKQFNAYLNG